MMNQDPLFNDRPQGQVVGNHIHDSNNYNSSSGFCKSCDRKKALWIVTIIAFIFIGVVCAAMDSSTALVSGIIFIGLGIVILCCLFWYYCGNKVKNPEVPLRPVPGQNQTAMYPGPHPYPSPSQTYLAQPFPTQPNPTQPNPTQPYPTQPNPTQPSASVCDPQSYPGQTTQTQLLQPAGTATVSGPRIQHQQQTSVPSAAPGPLMEPPPPSYEEVMSANQKQIQCIQKDK